MCVSTCLYVLRDSLKIKLNKFNTIFMNGRNLYIYIYIYIYIYMKYICIYIYVFVYVQCFYIYVYVHVRLLQE